MRKKSFLLLLLPAMVAIISIGHAANQTNVYHVSVITLLMQN
jgi:hypothetical protein